MQELSQDPPYIKKVHKALSENLSDFNKSEQELAEAIKDPSYAKKVHRALADNLSGFNKSETEFLSLVNPVKKKDTSEGTGQNKKSVSPLETASSDSKKLITGDPYRGLKLTPTKKTNVGEEVYKEYEKAKTVSDDQKRLIEEEVNADAENSGAWNMVRAGAGKIINPIYRMLTEWEATKSGEKRKELIDSDPLQSEKSQAKKELQTLQLQAQKEKKPAVKITEEVIKERAKEIAVKKRIDSKSESQVRELLETFDDYNPEKQVALIKYSDLKKKSFEEKDKILLGRQNITRDEIERSYSEIVSLQKEATEMQKKGIPVSHDFKQQYDEKLNDYNRSVQETKELHQKYIDNKENIGKFEDNLDVFKRDYSWMGNFVGNLGATSADIVSGLFGAGDYALNLKSALIPDSFKPISDHLDKPIRGFLKESADRAKQGGEKERNKIQKSLSVDDIHSASDFGDWLAHGVIANQLPILGLTATGAGGIAVLGASATGQKFEEMQNEIENGANYSQTDLAVAPAIFGATETASAMVDKFLMGNASRVLRSASEPERQLISQSLAKNLFDTTAKTAGQSIKSGATETLDESLTEIAQDITDKYILGKDIVIGANLKDVGAMGFVMGALIPMGAGGRKIATDIAKSFTSDDSKIQKLSKQIENYEYELTNPEITETSRNTITNQIDKKNKAIQDVLEETVNDINVMSSKQLNEIVSLERNQSELRFEAREINQDSSLSKEAKKQAISDLKEQFDTNESRRLDLVERGANTTLASLDEQESIRLQDLASRQLMKELNPDGTKNITLTENQIAKKAVQIYNKEQFDKNFTPLSTEASSVSTEATVTNTEPTNEQESETQEQTIESETQPQAEEQAEVGEITSEILPENETAPTENIGTDESLRPGSGIMDESGISEQENSGEENLQSTADSRPNQKPIKIKLSEKGDEYQVSFNNGRLDILDKKGKEPSKPTRRKIESKYAETFDFTKGELAPQTSEAVDTNKYIADTSNNPVEVAMTLLSIDNQSFVDENVSHRERVIAENIGKVKRQSFIDNNDANNINRSLAKSYFNNSGSSLDVLAKEMSEIAGVEITEQDIVEFILENPNGPQTFFTKAKRELRDPLQKRFSDLTGLPASDVFLKKAVEQQIAKDDFLNNVATEVLLMSEEELLSLQNEIQQSYEQEEGTITSTESEHSASNSTGSTEESRIQSESGRSDSKIESIEESGKVNLSNNLGIDEFIQNIDKAINKLDDFGKENLGMNLPLVVARQALMAMKVAAQTASTVADIVSAGLNAVKQSDWYKNLSTNEQTDLESNFTDYLNKPFQTNREKTRSKIEEEVETEIQNGTSEDAILDQYKDRREKMIAKDYLQRQKSVTDAEAKTIVDESFQRADDLLNDKKSLSEKISKLFRLAMTKFVDRQFLPKFVLNKAGGRLVRNYLIATKGASGYARMMYDEAHSKIYKGLSSKQIKTLDKVIQLRRFISIDENRAKRNMPAVVHPDYINENVARTYLKVLEDEMGTDAYNNLMKRSDAYFDTFKTLLDEMHKSGIISKESRDQFFDIDYQPRMFLEFLKKSEDEMSFDVEDTGGLSEPQIKKLEDGLDSSLVTDSQYLISRAINVRTKSIAMNNTNKKLVEFITKQKEKVDALRQKQDPSKKELETIKYFEELEQKIIPNPIIGFTDSGEPKYKTSRLPKGFRNAYFYVNGVKENVLMEENFHEQYFDNLKGFFNGNTKETVVLASGVGLVKSIATGNNPTFFITNTPRDFMFISTFSEEYGNNVLLNMAKLAKDTFAGINDIRKSSGNFNNFIRYGGMMDFLKDQGKFKGNKGLKKLLNKVDNKTRERVGTFFDYITLNKLQAYSEIGFRMAVFNRSIKNQLKEMGLKDISEVSDQNDVDDIYTNAVASARSTMDFNQGGTVVKDADALIPYLNAATQGTRVMFDNFRERPVETTLRVMQTATLLSSAVVGSSIAMLAAFNDDDDTSGAKLYQKALDGVSKYEQTNYFIVFTGKRTSDGEFEYYRIAKAQQLTPFFSATEGIMNDFIKASIGDKSKSRTTDNVGFALSRNISPLDFSVTGNVTRNPTLKAALSYSIGYDFFREQDLSYLKGKVPVQAEGFENKNVEDFYKKIGEDAGISPVRMKAAVESMITTPSTSPYVGFLYGGLDAMASDKEGKQILQKLGTDIAKSTVKRAMKETSDFNRRLNSREDIKDKLLKAEVETLKTKSKFKQFSEGLIDKTLTQKFVDSEISKIEKENPFEAKRLAKMIADKVKNKDISPYAFEIKYARTADHKALLLLQLFGDNMKNPKKLDREEKKLYEDLKRIKAITREAELEYQKMINKKTAD